MSAHHDPKGEVNCKKGPRSKNEQKIPVKTLSVTWRHKTIDHMGMSRGELQAASAVQRLHLLVC